MRSPSAQRSRRAGQDLAAWLVGFAPVLYLALRGGGYDPVVRGEVALVLWWVLIVGAAAGLGGFRHVGRAGWAAVGLLAALLAWSALGLTVTESAERTVADLGKLSGYLAMLLLALAVRRRGRGRWLMHGLGCALGLVISLAVLSRIRPEWFPVNAVVFFFPSDTRRLGYPFGYWNALAAAVAMALPVLIAQATHARSLAGRALASAALPVLPLCLYLTFSRGGVLSCAGAVGVSFLLARPRLPWLITVAIAGTGAGVLVALASQRDAFRLATGTQQARDQGEVMLQAIVAVGVLSAALVVGLALAQRAIRQLRRPLLSRSTTRSVAAAVAAVAILGGGLAGGAGAVDTRWEDFKSPDTAASNSSSLGGRLQSSAGNGRYQFWQAAEDAASAHPLLGTGSGTFEFWWARNGTLSVFVRDAHSLYLQTLGELGYPGLVLLVGFLLVVLVTGSRGALRAPSEARAWRAAAVASTVGFCIASAFEWIWQSAALPSALMILAAVALPTVGRSALRRRTDGAPASGPGSVEVEQLEEEVEEQEEAKDDEPRRRPRLPGRVVVVAVGVAGLLLAAVPLAGVVELRQSQAASTEGRTADALDAARTGQRVQPYSASLRLQEALVLEASGQLGPAAEAAARGTDAAPTDWRGWVVRSRIDAERGRAATSVRFFRKARSLNPRSQLFTGP